ncbi:PKD domain-containing protein [Agromyces sp. CFH 90414]|uniref:PKD domain-containing protein n=1 Tax=Agromyces agglutinans TaxID=2662258 RepID=A0A6I2FCA7_9MICO|nr:LamG-like jellyroll fold domain-containing protein [Agromyces agglutinans]MRG60096.1 PKD domain-containing protein [Agromyces agglutinans]
MCDASADDAGATVATQQEPIEPASGSRRGRRVFVAAVAVVLAGLFSTAVAAAPAQADTAPPVGQGPETVSADPLPTAQIDGVVWTQTASATTVYAGGQFTKARPAGAAAGTNETARNNLLAYNAETGALTGWNPSPNGRVLGTALSPDGSRLYVAGTFTSIAGETRYRLAAFDTATGTLVANWRPGTNALVNDIVATASTVYLVGEFTNVNNVARTRVAAVSASTGALLPFNPVLAGGYGARAVVVSPDQAKVVIGGSFTSTNGSTNPGRGLAALDAATGASLPWAINSVIRNGGNNAAIYSLASDGDSVYGSGYDFGGSKTEDDFEGSFRASWSDGSMVWMEDCHGDTYSVFPQGDVVYKAGHSHYCGNIGEFPQLDPWYLNHALAFAKEPSTRAITPDIWGYRSFTGNTAGKLLHWYPTWFTGSATGIGQAGWDVTANSRYVFYGGEFTGINGIRQQGLVRFAKKDVATNKTGPTIQGGQWEVTTTSFRAGAARISWRANHDADNAVLKYELFKRNVSAPLVTKEVSSTYWVRELMSHTDTDVTPGQTYEYRVRATDPSGNSTVSDWTAVTVANEGSSTPLDDAILGDEPTYYWPLNEASGTAGYDWATGNDVVTTANATRGQAGPITGGNATRFTGSDSFAATRVSEVGPNTFSVEAWFRTTSSSGGKIVGFGDRNSGTSGNYDRHIYIDGSGRISFGVHPGAVRVVQSDTGYNDGDWHQVVGTLSPGGQELYVDGRRVGARADTTSGQAYSGYWRIGGDNLGGWPNVGNQYLNGTIGNVAVYQVPLKRAEVDAHWVASGRTSTLPAAPADAYGKAVFDLGPSLYWRLGETSGSTAADTGPDGSSATYAGQVVKNQAGALAGVSNAAARFNPSKNIFGTWTTALVASSRSYANPTTFAIETWVKTSTTTGGKIVGFGSSRTGLSESYDRHVYMNPDGRLNFGVWTGAAQVIQTPQSYNDNQWHHIVAQMSPNGMELYVDGVLAGTHPNTVAQDYTGFWRVGGDNGWDGDPWFKGTVDEVAVYPAPLSAVQVAQHRDLGIGVTPNQPPTADFTVTTEHLDAAFTSVASDGDGSVVDHAWTFGDGATASGASASHTYGAAGTYAVTLTVTDDDGATAAKSVDVTVTAPPPPNEAPTAAFTQLASGRMVAFDGATSSDPDGSVVGYAWDFGDGSTGAGAAPTHEYAAAGTYDVELTVTDDDGATDSVAIDVTVTDVPPPTVLAQDAFGRTVSGGWGSADTGGAWTALGGAAAFSVANGSGIVSLIPSHTREGRLSGVSQAAATIDVQFSSDVASVGGTASATVIGRQVGTATYSGRVRLEPNGIIRLYILRDEVALGGGSYVLPGAYVPGEILNVRVEVSGTNPTTVKGKVWRNGSPEPAWQLQGSDSTAGLQAAGTIGIKSALSSVSTVPTTRLSYDNLRVVIPQ